jgi:hypothetical protein
MRRESLAWIIHECSKGLAARPIGTSQLEKRDAIALQHWSGTLFLRKGGSQNPPSNRFVPFADSAGRPSSQSWSVARERPAVSANGPDLPTRDGRILFLVLLKTIFLHKKRFFAIALALFKIIGIFQV